MSRPERKPGTGISPVAWCATALFGLILVFWSILTPGYRTPDEPQHVNSVLRVYDGGGWPPPGSATMSESVLRSRTLTGFTETDGHRGKWGGGNLLPALEDIQRYKHFPRFSDQEPSPASARLPFDQLTTNDLDGRVYMDQMSQHPPLYYAVQAGILHLVGAEDLRFDQELAVMRWISALMVVWLPLCAYVATKRVTGSRRLGELAALVPLAIPQLAHIGASVTNDALAVGLGGALTMLLAVVLTANGGPGGRPPLDPGRMRWLLLGIGVVLGLTCFTKGVLLSAVPVTAVAVLVGLRRWRREAGRTRPLVWGAAVLGVAFAAGGWWYAVNLIRYGTLQPDAFAIDQRPVVADPGTWWDFASKYAHDVSASFWGWFGWQELPMSTSVSAVLTIALVACCAAGGVVAVVLARRHGSRGDGMAVPILLSFPVLTAAALFLTTHEMNLHTGNYPGLQGRYLYGGLAALSVAAAVGLGGIARLLRIPLHWLVPVAAAAAFAVQGYGMLTAFRGFYLPADWTISRAWQRMVDWSPWGPGLVGGIALAMATAALATLVVCVWAARRLPPDVVARPPVLPPAEPQPRPVAHA